MEDGSFYKITIGGRNLEHPINSEDCERVEKTLKSHGYNLVNFIPSEVFIAAKIAPKIRDTDISALEGICTIVEDKDMIEEMKHAY